MGAKDKLNIISLSFYHISLSYALDIQLILSIHSKIESFSRWLQWTA